MKKLTKIQYQIYFIEKILDILRQNPTLLGKINYKIVIFASHLIKDYTYN